MGAAVAREMVKKLEEKNGSAKGKILEITGLMGSSPAIGRQEGMMSVLKDYPEIEILATGDGEWIREPAVKLMEDWLIAYDEIDAVFSHAEESSWGAQLAIERAGRQDEGIMHFTMDASNEGFVDVKAGVFMADGNYTPYIGQLGVRAALYSLMGKEITGTESYEYGTQMVLPDLPVVTPENAEEWIGKGWGEY
jgi:ribose transport system substrate-binding protein